MGKVYFSLIICAVIWGFQPVCIKWLVAEWSPVTITFLRYAIVASAMFALAARRGLRLRTSRAIMPNLILMGLTGVLLNCVLQFEGLKAVPVTNCTLISATTPAMIAALSAIFLRERLHSLSWLGIVLSFTGVMLVVSGGSLAVILGVSFARGDLLCLASQLAWAVFSLLSLAVLRELSVVAETAWFSLFGAFWTLGYGLATNDIHFAPLDVWGAASFFYTSVIGGIIVMLTWNYGVKKAGASKSGIFLNLMPLVGMASGFLIMGEPIGPLQLLGAALVIGGVALTTRSGKSSQ